MLCCITLMCNNLPHSVLLISSLSYNLGTEIIDDAPLIRAFILFSVL